MRITVIAIVFAVLAGCSSGTDPVKVTGPVADAGEGYSIEFGNAIYLDGTGSTHTGGLDLTYAWTLTGVPGASTLATADIVDSDSALASFEPDVTGDFKFQLEVSDGARSDTDTVTVTVDLPPGVVGAWFFSGSFDERSGTAVTTTAVVGNPGFTIDRYGAADAALDLPSGQDGLEIANYPDIESTPNGLSLSFWISQTGGDGRVISRRYGVGTVSWEFDIVGSYESMRLSYGGSTVGSNISIGTYFTEPMNHIVMIFDTGNERWKLYINEVQVFDYHRTSDIQTTNPVAIGRTGLSGMTGQFDDLIIFNRPVNESEIHALYHHH